MRQILIFLLLLQLSSIVPKDLSPLIVWAHHQGVILGNVELESQKFKASRDLYRKELIFSIPLNNTLHPLEDYPFKEYFNLSSKDTLIGRLIIEKILGNESSLYFWMESLPKPNEMNDLYHFSSIELQDFLSRSYEEFTNLKNRKEKYLKIRKNLPQEVLNEQSFNYEVYNWAASIVDSWGCFYEFDSYEPGKLGVVRLMNPNILGISNLILIPLIERIGISGIEIQKPGVFNEDYEENPQSFKYIIQKGENLEIRTQKLIEKGEEVKLIDGKSNREYIQYNGILLKEDHAKDFLLRFKPDFDMERIRLCWDLNLSQKKSLVFGFQLLFKSLNINLLLYGKIAMLKEKNDYEDDKKELLKRFEDEGLRPRLETFLVYERLLMNKWKEVKKDKTSLEDDLKEFNKAKLVANNERKIMNLEFNLNSKAVFFRNVLMVQRKILREIKKDFSHFNQRL